MVIARKLSLTALIVGLAMMLGGAARTYKLADRSVALDEMSTPATLLHADTSVLLPELDLAHVLRSDLFYGTHPPGYPLMMFGVTRVFGTSLTASRLPSVLFGVASIGLVYWLGLLIGRRVPGCIAALLLAFNGYHIVRSQTADTYSLACFLSLLATVLLILLAQETRRKGVIELCYGAVMLFGLSSQHYFWVLLATQMVWVLANAWIQDRSLPRLLNIQIFVVILGSPLLTIARLQSLNGVADLGARFAVVAREYVQFFWILPGVDDIPVGFGIANFLPYAVTLALRVLLGLFCIWILIEGFRRLYPVDDPTLSAPAKPFIGLWILATILATLVDVALVFATRHQIDLTQGPWDHTFHGVEFLTVLPSILVMGAITLSQSWQHLSAFGRGLNPGVLAGGQRLILLQTFIPFAMLAIVSLFLHPLLNARGLLFVAPYLLLTLAFGIAAIGRRSRSLAIALFFVIATLHACSLWAYFGR
jgi:4-amino-4-deoxy-L-arabinose transferase-like glycosyltransferase